MFPTFEADPLEVLSPEEVLGVGLGTDVLIVDDNAGNLEAYEAALAPLGRTVVRASSGVGALAVLLQQDFALILLDVSMPGMTGLEAARMIRERPRSRATPIIFITGMSSSTEVMLEAYDAGALDFIVKPIVPEVLRAKVSVYLQLQDRTRQLLRQAAEIREMREQLAATRGLEKLQVATAALARTTTPAEVAALAVRLGSEAVGATAAGMWLTAPDGSLVLEANHAIPDSYVERWRVIPAGTPSPANRVITTRVPMWVASAEDYAREAPEVYELARAAGRVRPFAALPLLHGDRSVGVMTFTFDSTHEFSSEERSFLPALVRTCEQSLERSRLYAAEAEARATAEAGSRRKDEFLAMLGHELRNPLAAMMGAIELLKIRGGSSGRELTILDRQLGHLTHVVGDLVDVSRITRGQIMIQREPVALADAVGGALEMVQPQIARHVHSVHVDVPSGLVVDADRQRLRQVIANLLTNAAIYTPDGGRIEITATREDGVANLAIRDNGRGIPAALLASMFDLFVQGERTLERREGGLGIGLTLARTVVALHGGTIAAHSEGPGTGATFTVRWPLASAPVPTRTPSHGIARTGEVLRILIVDDNVDSAEMTAAVLTELGHEVTIAHDGQRALELASIGAPQVALLDIGLPVIDGYELARRLRQVPGCEGTVLVAVSGYGQPEDRERSHAAGFSQHLVKPVGRATMTAILDAAVTSS